MTTNTRAISDAFVARGVETVFGLMGNGNLDVLADLIDRHKVDYLGARHESGAVAAADGYARAGQRIGVASITHGPGFTNSLTALMTASRARTPLLVVAGNASENTGRSTQKLDQVRVAEALGVPVIAPGVEGDWRAACEAALDATATGTVLLDLPARAMTDPSRTLSRSERRNVVPAEVNVTRLREAADWLISAERPMIVAGRGAVRAGVRKLLVDAAATIGARLGTSLAARGLFSGMPGDVGLVGGLGSPQSTAACQACDAVLVVGAGLNGFTTEHGTLFRNAKVMRVGVAETASIPVHLEIAGEPGDVVKRLVKHLPNTARPAWQVPPSIAEHATRRQGWPGPLLDVVEHALPAARTIVYDHGDLPNASVPFFSANDPSQSIFMPDFGSLGLAVAAATGAAYAAPDRRTIAVVGDGGMMMSLPDLDTLKRSGKPVVVIVLNDGVYGAEYPHLRHMGASLGPVTFDSASMADIGRAIGLNTLRVRERDDLNAITAVIRTPQGPTLIEVVCHPPT